MKKLFFAILLSVGWIATVEARWLVETHIGAVLCDGCFTMHHVVFWEDDNTKAKHYMGHFDSTGGWGCPCNNTPNPGNHDEPSIDTIFYGGKGTVNASLVLSIKKSEIMKLEEFQESVLSAKKLYIKRNTDSITNLVVVPNPISFKQGQFYVNVPKTEKYRITIYSINGHNKWFGTKQLNAGSNNLSDILSNISRNTGVYVVEVVGLESDFVGFAKLVLEE